MPSTFRQRPWGGRFAAGRSGSRAKGLIERASLPSGAVVPLFWRRKRMAGKQYELANALQQLSLVNEKLAEVFDVLKKVNKIVHSYLANPPKPMQLVQWTPEKVRELRNRFDES